MPLGRPSPGHGRVVWDEGGVSLMYTAPTMPTLDRLMMALWCWDWCEVSRAGRLGHLGIAGGEQQGIMMISLAMQSETTWH
jgi:hypothetical protein